jgi:F-type H+-transporting ATPase subunit b
MLIDWFTVVAQAVNFLILVWLLKRFLYAPILRAIDEREQRIAGQLQLAAARKAEAEQERAAFEGKNKAFDEQRQALLKEAEKDVSAERRRLLDEARAAADALRARLQDAVRSEHASLSRELVRRSQREVFAIAGKALADLAGTSLEERVALVFVRRLHELPPAERQLLAAVAGGHQPAVVRSAFELPPAPHAAIEQAVRDTLGPETLIRFEVAPDIVSGVELAVPGYKVAWSIADYLAMLEDSLRVAVNTATASEAPSGARA